MALRPTVYLFCTPSSVCLFVCFSFCQLHTLSHTVRQAAKTWSASAKLCNTHSARRPPIGRTLWKPGVWLTICRARLARSPLGACRSISFTNLRAERLADMWTPPCLYWWTHVQDPQMWARRKMPLPRQVGDTPSATSWSPFSVYATFNQAARRF